MLKEETMTYSSTANRIRAMRKTREGMKMKWIFNLSYLITIASVSVSVSAFVVVRQPPSPPLLLLTTTTTSQQQQHQQQQHDPIVGITRRRTALSARKESEIESSSTATAQKDDDENVEIAFDELLEDPSTFRKAIHLLESNSDHIELSRDRFERIFEAIEERTSEAELQNNNAIAQGGQGAEQGLFDSKLISQSRDEMTEMYVLLKEQGHLRLFGSIGKENWLASGSHTVRPTMLETITSLSMTALTPKSTNTLLYAGIVVAALESIASEYMGWNLNVLFFASFTAALCDQLLLNGALAETSAKIIDRGMQAKITRHEAGHFLCSYILGCPVEGYCLSAFSALQDPRFRGRGVSAGTSFFDPELSKEMANSKITRSSIDRYSIIVMAGIAAEATSYGQADGGAGDEQALIGFLSNLNGANRGSSSSPSSSAVPAWNDVTIRNQARWGALQAVLILREYQDCYEALVDALERGGSLGDCIYAIENAGRRRHNNNNDNNEPTTVPRLPLGYISEEGDTEIWTTVLPNNLNQNNNNNSNPTTGTTMNKSSSTGTTNDRIAAGTGADNQEIVVAPQSTTTTTIKKESILDTEESLVTLQSYKDTIAQQLREIDEKLEGL